MAAGLGFKTFAVGEVLSAANVNGYLMQGVLVFANATARDAAITSPQEGQFAFTKDNDSLWYYSGSAWVSSGATGDIEGVTAGVGISGGGTSGTVTVTNSMATAIDAKGDLIAGTGADTFSRLAVGTNGHTLVADSSEATGLKWAAPASGGGMTLLSTTTLSGTTTTVSSISGSYKHLLLIIDRITSSTSGSYNNLDITANSLTTQSQTTTLQRNSASHTLANILFGPLLITNMQSAAGNQSIAIWVYNYADTARFKPYSMSGTFTGTSPDGNHVPFVGGGAIASTDAINAFTFTMVQSSTNGGTVQIYGVS